MIDSKIRRRFLLGTVAVVALAGAIGAVISSSDNGAASGQPAAAAPAALPVSVSVVEQLDLPEGPIVLAGGTFRAAPRLAAALETAIRERLPRAATRVLTVEPALGAVRLAIALVKGEARIPAYRHEPNRENLHA